MYKAYYQYCQECERSNMEPLTYAEWEAMEDMLD